MRNFIVLALLLFLGGCGGDDSIDCDVDQARYTTYGKDIAAERAEQAALAVEYSASTDNNRKAQIMGLIGNSLIDENRLEKEQQSLAEHSKCKLQ